ncbi:GNAT family N-acetyltransferase [Halomonas sp. BM-2019]|uniref:GNAT family N-acetyltransferase n=1 Tax=Halomonas sp. BM-2019 TaxID=2811227 RepID=UPI001B3C3122|nr:MAG: GNAT family N-acetyltransferase [Halomonas sp. BM-2019]
MTRRTSSSTEPLALPFTVRRVESAADADEFARIVCTGFDLAEAFRGVVHGLAKKPNWHLFMTFEGDTPIGTGGLHVLGNLGWFDFGATDPDHRMRGSQRTLMAVRLRHAAAQGCRTLITATGEAVEGDPQHSYGNITRAGFRPVYTRENYGPPRRGSSQ